MLPIFNEPLPSLFKRLLNWLTAINKDSEFLCGSRSRYNNSPKG